MSLTLISPSIIEELQITEPYMVVIFNDDTTPFETVIGALIRATDCSSEEAELETWEAHHCGKASVHYAGRE
ncbi:ATP-dependent Clp protease adaptor ClpS, partial [bacterium]